jgi:hypothetical protein
MKKLALLVVLVAVAAVSAVMVSGALASGTPTVVTGFACNVFDENGGLFVTFQSNDTTYASGKETLHCIGQSPTGGNGTVVTYSGFGCNLLNSSSANPLNSDRVSKTGESQLWCYGSVTTAPSGPAGAVG